MDEAEMEKARAAYKEQKAGCRMVGMKEVKGKTDPWSRKQEILPALVFEIN